MPVWQSIYDELNDPNFVIISAAQDTGGKDAADSFFEEANVSYVAIIDTEHTISSLYNLVNVPSAVWIDESGQIVRINEGAYASEHSISGFKFGTHEYAPALKDWVKNGGDSQYVWSPETVAAKIRPRSSDEDKAETLFKLGVHFYSAGDEERANNYWDDAQKLHPDSWNFHRQDWSFLPMAETNRNFLGKRKTLTKPYYAPLELD